MKTFKKILRISLHFSLYLTLAVFLLTGLLRITLLISARHQTYQPAEVQEAPAALVLGAGLNRDGSPGIVLRDRVRTAAELYFDGRVKKLLMSGDNSTEYYNEPGAMMEYAISLGVPEEDIVLDYAGRRTYDSCYRAKAIFGLDQVIIITQAFHLPRALFLCNAFEVESDGVPADDSNYRLRYYTFWWVREILASIKAFWDVYITQPELVLGEPEPIFPE
ncbi:MAG: SanA/YdcF family protein [Brevefilum sp.]